MDVIVSRQQSTLNPNAPMFVPQSYRTVEDFSPEWWALVHSSPWFRDYWLQLNFNDPQHDPFVSDDPLFPDESDLFDDLIDEYPIQVEKKKDLVSMGMLKGKKDRGAAKAPRFVEKAPKIVNVKMSPRPIQQPR